MDIPDSERRRGTEEQEVLLREVARHLADDAGYALHGDAYTDAWGSHQWVSFTGPDGKLQFFKVVVEPFKSPGPPAQPARIES